MNAASISCRKFCFGARGYKCIICCMILSSASALMEHRECHQSEEPLSLFYCQKCPFTSDVYDQIRRHELIHTANRPFKCSVCKKGFAYKHVLKRHLIVHTKEKPYFCDLCPSQYRYLWDLKKHRNLHRLEAQFEHLFE